MTAIVGVAAGTMPSGCSASWRVDRLDVRLRVRGREVDQAVRITPPVVVPCAR
ncbi:hypothetical protein C8N24_0096 [Solirubrobacter pauli]|uniref:Uncharacterized protein n=1 Tax=Solirubrobacter pauli TaxID=166793 RepID=A0A660L7E0_9ACTN|nr:hypothetical protein [Solirubrobacter pauli]RKQ90296.1 hypothetical protein C8N24_0096 [Solirubrobacter pauli]